MFSQIIKRQANAAEQASDHRRLEQIDIWSSISCHSVFAVNLSSLAANLVTDRTVEPPLTGRLSLQLDHLRALALSRARLPSLTVRTAATARIGRWLRNDDLQLRLLAVRIIIRSLRLVSILLNDQLYRRRFILGTGRMVLRTAVLVFGFLFMLLMVLIL